MAREAVQCTDESIMRRTSESCFLLFCVHVRTPGRAKDTTLHLLSRRWFDANVWDKSRTQITDELVALAVKTLPEPPGADGIPEKSFKDALSERVALIPDQGEGSLNRGTLTYVWQELNNCCEMA